MLNRCWPRATNSSLTSMPAGNSVTYMLRSSSSWAAGVVAPLVLARNEPAEVVTVVTLGVQSCLIPANISVSVCKFPRAIDPLTGLRIARKSLNRYLLPPSFARFGDIVCVFDLCCQSMSGITCSRGARLVMPLARKIITGGTSSMMAARIPVSIRNFGNFQSVRSCRHSSIATAPHSFN